MYYELDRLHTEIQDKRAAVEAVCTAANAAAEHETSAMCCQIDATPLVAKALHRLAVTLIEIDARDEGGN